MTIKLFLLLVAGVCLLLPGCSTTSSEEAELVAENNAFNLTEIRAEAGGEITFIFENRDNTTHNFAVYATAAAKQPIFRGEPLTGPGTIVYSFLAPFEPNFYHFQCDFHPTTMNGDFVVGGSGS